MHFFTSFLHGPEHYSRVYIMSFSTVVIVWHILDWFMRLIYIMLFYSPFTVLMNFAFRNSLNRVLVILIHESRVIFISLNPILTHSSFSASILLSFSLAKHSFNPIILTKSLHFLAFCFVYWAIDTSLSYARRRLIMKYSIAF